MQNEVVQMKNPFAPNGVTSTKIICELAREEFGDIINKSANYVSLKKDIIY